MYCRLTSSLQLAHWLPWVRRKLLLKVEMRLRNRRQWKAKQKTWLWSFCSWSCRCTHIQPNAHFFMLLQTWWSSASNSASNLDFRHANFICSTTLDWCLAPQTVVSDWDSRTSSVWQHHCYVTYNSNINYSLIAKKDLQARLCRQ